MSEYKVPIQLAVLWTKCPWPKCQWPKCHSCPNVILAQLYIGPNVFGPNVHSAKNVLGPHVFGPIVILAQKRSSHSMTLMETAHLGKEICILITLLIYKSLNRGTVCTVKITINSPEAILYYKSAFSKLAWAC